MDELQKQLLRQKNRLIYHTQVQDYVKDLAKRLEEKLRDLASKIDGVEVNEEKLQELLTPLQSNIAIEEKEIVSINLKIAQLEHQIVENE